MTTVETVEAIKVLTNSLQVLAEMESKVEDRNEKVIGVIRDKIFDCVKHI